MEREHKNMQDIRNSMHLKTLRWKIEKRMLERMGHVFRMEDGRQTKVAVLGWLKELEETDKCPGRKRKTLLYWKKLIREAGWDWTKISTLTSDRDRWRNAVKERMDHLGIYEMTKSNQWREENGEGPQRNVLRDHQQEEDLVCQVEDCGRRC